MKEAKALHQSKVKAVVNIIGFDLDDKSQKALEQVATAGGGEFTNVSSGEELRDGFDIWTYIGRTTELTWWDIENSNRLFWERQGAYEYIWDLLGSSVQPGKIGSLSDQEYEHMEAAVQFLVDQKIIPETMGGYDGAVTKKLDKRREMLKQYQQKLKDQKMKEINEAYDRVMDLMEKIKKRENAEAETYMP